VIRVVVVIVTAFVIKVVLCVRACVRVRRIFDPKREEVAGGWRTQHNEELHNLYASLNATRVIK
jgi:hypothetical protein